MTCCSSVSVQPAIGGTTNELTGSESDIRRGESVECAMARGGNTTGLHDDATDNAANRIDNTAVPVSRSVQAASISTAFKLTANSTRVASSWTLTCTPPSTVMSMTTAGVLSGSWAAHHAELNKTFKLQITASDDTEIDTRGFTVTPTIGGKDDEVRFISPLPGGYINSKYGMRMHPIYKVMKPHTGVDMKMENRSVQDIVAAADGEVISPCGGDLDAKIGYGIRVLIKHISSSGAHLCTSTYNHLSSVYVSVGQKVMAGQAIGREGTSGSSTGNHLHFEVRLPDGKFVDPEPLINGVLKIADKTLTNGDGDPTSMTARTSSASMSGAEASARQKSCAVFGPNYPQAVPPETTDALPVSNDPFERAWLFTMKEEVGQFWTIAFEADPEVMAGLIDTADQRRKVGYVNRAGFPGGETKFGVAQKPNPSFNVRTAEYAPAKKLGFNNYWKSSKVSCTTYGPLVSIMLFDMNYLHGDGNSRSILSKSGINIPDMSYAGQLTACETLALTRLAFIQGLSNVSQYAGWITRAKACLVYIKSLPLY